MSLTEADVRAMVGALGRHPAPPSTRAEPTMLGSLYEALRMEAVYDAEARVSAESPSVQHMWLRLVSEGGLEPVERPLDKRVSDILSAKMDPGGPGCTPLFGIGALLERTKVASDNDPGTKSEPGMSDPGSLSWGRARPRVCGSRLRSMDRKALRWRGLKTPKSVFSVPASSLTVFRVVRSICDEVRVAGAMRG